MASSTIKHPQRTSVLSYPLCIEKLFNANTTWLPSTSFKVEAGDYFRWNLKTSSTTGELTRNIEGSVGGIYQSDGPGHSRFNNGEPFVEHLCKYDEIITIHSYTNAASTITSSVTITRQE